MKTVYKNISESNAHITFAPVAVIASAGCIMLMISPSLSVSSAKKGLELWLFTVVPSMMPFFVFTDMIMRSGAAEKCGRFAGGVMKFLMGTPEISGFVFASSVISGYPSGARIIGEMFREGRLDRAQAENMLTFCSTSGPLFIIGAVGAGMFRSDKSGYILLISHYLSAIAAGLILSDGSILSGERKKSSAKRYEYAGRSQNCGKISESCGRKPVTEIMSEAINSSFGTLISIGGYIIIFSIITAYIDRFAACAASGAAADALHIISGLMEMTVGCSGVCSMKNISYEIAMIICSFLISFGGISVAAQSMTVLKGTGIGAGTYFRIKIVQAVSSALITMIML